MCSSFAEGLAHCGIEAKIVYPLEMDIAHCAGCGECSETEDCIISDDMDVIYKLFKEADIVALATPIHFSGPSSIIKIVIDRFQPYWFYKEEHPQYSVGLMTGGGGSPNFNNTASIFRAFSITTEMEYIDDLRISNTDEIEIEEVSVLSEEFGKKIGKELKDRHQK